MTLSCLIILFAPCLAGLDSPGDRSGQRSLDGRNPRGWHALALAGEILMDIAGDAAGVLIDPFYWLWMAVGLGCKKSLGSQGDIDRRFLRHCGVLPGKSTTLMYASTVQQTILGNPKLPEPGQSCKKRPSRSTRPKRRPNWWDGTESTTDSTDDRDITWYNYITRENLRFSLILGMCYTAILLLIYIIRFFFVAWIFLIWQALAEAQDAYKKQLSAELSCSLVCLSQGSDRRDRTRGWGVFCYPLVMTNIAMV